MTRLYVYIVVVFISKIRISLKATLEVTKKNHACVFAFDRQISALCNVFAPSGILMMAFVYFKPNANWISCVLKSIRVALDCNGENNVCLL